MSWSGFKKNVGRATTQVMFMALLFSTHQTMLTVTDRMKTGHVEKTNDREYEVEERRYRTLESASLRLQKEAKGYLDSLRAMTASQMRIAETIDAFYGDSGAKDGVSRSYKQAVEDLDAETVKALDGPYRCVTNDPEMRSMVKMSDDGTFHYEVLDDIEAELNFKAGNRRNYTRGAWAHANQGHELIEYVCRTTVLEPINRFCAYFPDINECIKKRNHKLLDYDSMRSKVKKLTEKPDKDPSKLPRTEKETEMVNATPTSPHPEDISFVTQNDSFELPSPPKALDGLKRTPRTERPRWTKKRGATPSIASSGSGEQMSLLSWLAMEETASLASVGLGTVETYVKEKPKLVDTAKIKADEDATLRSVGLRAKRSKLAKLRRISNAFFALDQQQEAPSSPLLLSPSPMAPSPVSPAAPTFAPKKSPGTPSKKISLPIATIPETIEELFQAPKSPPQSLANSDPCRPGTAGDGGTPRSKPKKRWGRKLTDTPTRSRPVSGISFMCAGLEDDASQATWKRAPDPSLHGLGLLSNNSSSVFSKQDGQPGQKQYSISSKRSSSEKSDTATVRGSLSESKAEQRVSSDSWATIESNNKGEDRVHKIDKPHTENEAPPAIPLKNPSRSGSGTSGHSKGSSKTHGVSRTPFFHPSELEEILAPLKQEFVKEMTDELAQAKAAYDQLNQQLTDELPQLIDLRVPYLDPSFEALVKIQLRFCAEAYSRMAQVQQYLDASTRDQYASGDLDARVEDVLGQIRELSIAGTV